MSKLSNAPLVEVIFEMRWDSTSKQDVDKFQLLIGAMYAALKASYEKPVNLLPDPNLPIQAFLNKPVYRSTKRGEDDVLYQLGPGVLSINHVGANYDWGVFYQEISTIVTTFKALYGFDSQRNIRMGLKYLDFFELSLKENDILTFLKEKIHISVDAPFIKNPTGLNFAVSQKENDSLFSLKINTGTLNNEREGLIVESFLTTTKQSEALFSLFDEKLQSFHSELCAFFKSLTQGELYASFNK